MKERIKNIKRRLARWFLPMLIYGIMRLLRATMRMEIVGAEIPRPFHARGEGVIHIFWHGRMLMMPFVYQGTCMNVLISTHGDGEIIANVMRRFGFDLVRGSSSRGGKEALREMVRLLRGNKDISITPDGPRGPAEVLKEGVAQVARLTGRPVIPVSFAATRAKRFPTWDRFLLPMPFSRATVVLGDPLYYVDGEDGETFRLRIEAALRNVTARADDLAGRS